MALAPAVTAFDRATAVEPLGDGVWGATIDADWFAPMGPNGGYVAALVLRALQEAVADAERAPRSLTLHYLRPPAAGPCEVRVEVERSGRSLTSLSARLEQEGRPMALALAAFATSFPAVADYAGPAPPAAAPGELHLAPEHPLTPPVARRVALQPLFGPAPLSGAGEALVGGWMRLEDPRPADAATVAFYTDAWLPSPWPRLSEPAPAPTVDLTIHFRTRLPLAGADAGAPVLARFHSTTAHDGFFEEDGEVWSVDGTLLAQSRQLGILRPR